MERILQYIQRSVDKSAQCGPIRLCSYGKCAKNYWILIIINKLIFYWKSILLRLKIHKNGHDPKRARFSLIKRQNYIGCALIERQNCEWEYEHKFNTAKYSIRLEHTYEGNTPEVSGPGADGAAVLQEGSIWADDDAREAPWTWTSSWPWMVSSFLIESSACIIYEGGSLSSFCCSSAAAAAAAAPVAAAVVAWEPANCNSWSCRVVSTKISQLILQIHIEKIGLISYFTLCALFDGINDEHSRRRRFNDSPRAVTRDAER